MFLQNRQQRQAHENLPEERRGTTALLLIDATVFQDGCRAGVVLRALRFGREFCWVSYTLAFGVDQVIRERSKHFSIAVHG